MIKNEVYTGEEILKKWPETAEWISNCHFLNFEIEFEIIPIINEFSEVMEYHDSGIRTITIKIREFSESQSRIRDDSRPFDTSKEPT